MKVLHVYKTYLPEDFTGVPRVIHAIATGQRDMGVETHVLTVADVPQAGGAIDVDGHVVHQVRRTAKIASTDLSGAFFARFRDLAAQVDVVNYHFPWPIADLAHLLYARNVPSVVTYHSDIVRQRTLLRLYAPLQHAFLSRVGAIVATSPNYLATSPVLAVHRDRATVIPIGIGPRTVPGVERVERWRAELGSGFFLFVGALRYYKGIGTLLEAARRSDHRIIVAGAPGEDLGSIPPNVTLVGAVSEDDKEALLELCQAFVFPSHLRSEAFGVALLEAARAGRPMVSCEIGTGTSFVNHHHETGLVIAPADPDALATAMDVLAGDKGRTAAMGVAARTRFETLFTGERQASSYHALYGSLIQPSS